MKNIILILIANYKKIAHVLRVLRMPIFIYTDCKFYPSCSDYTAEAVTKYGILRGLLKSLLRILKCAPFSMGGVDIP